MGRHVLPRTLALHGFLPMDRAAKRDRSSMDGFSFFPRSRGRPGSIHSIRAAQIHLHCISACARTTAQPSVRMSGNFRCTGACRSCRLLCFLPYSDCLADLLICLGSCDAPVLEHHPCTCGLAVVITTSVFAPLKFRPFTMHYILALYPR
jgi:hypothetical protein